MRVGMMVAGEEKAGELSWSHNGTTVTYITKVVMIRHTHVYVKRVSERDVCICVLVYGSGGGEGGGAQLGEAQRSHHKVCHDSSHVHTHIRHIFQEGQRARCVHVYACLYDVDITPHHHMSMRVCLM